MPKKKPRPPPARLPPPPGAPVAGGITGGAATGTGIANARPGACWVRRLGIERAGAPDAARTCVRPGVALPGAWPRGLWCELAEGI
jgi:hypothetical protein